MLDEHQVKGTIFACAVAFGTPFLFYSRTFFSHAWTASLLFLAWDLIGRSEETPRRRSVFLFAAGLLAGTSSMRSKTAFAAWEPTGSTSTRSISRM